MMGPYRFVVLTVVLAVLAACGGDDETAPAGATEAVDGPSAAAATNPTLIFDGTTCTYEGPTQVVVGGLTPVALENTSDIDIDAVLLSMPSQEALDAAVDRLPPGSGSDITLDMPPGSTQEAWLQAGPGERNEEALLLEPGLFLMDCGRVPSGASLPDYVWRGGSFEGVEG